MEIATIAVLTSGAQSELRKRTSQPKGLHHQRLSTTCVQPIGSIKSLEVVSFAHLEGLVLSWCIVRVTAGLLLTFWITQPLFAQSNHAAEPIEEVLVFGRSTDQIGIATSASQGFVGLDDIDPPPLLRVGELAEAVPGMTATQHSGTGKANQYFLRGFNLDHGTDFSAQLNGIPLNMRTHGHGQGYLDLNPIIPELVTTIRYQKGPYSARDGDFSSAGSVRFDYGANMTAPLLKVSAGSFGYRRSLIAASNARYTVAADSTRYAGPWELDENLRQNKGHLGWTLPIGKTQGRLEIDYYDSNWRATDQIPRRAVAQKQISPSGFIDPDLGGNSRRYSINMSMSDDTTDGRLYVISSKFQLFSNFTYFLENPNFGDEFEQIDERTLWGGKFHKSYDMSGPLSMSAGLEFQHDNISRLELNGTSSRLRIRSVRDDTVDQTSVAGYIETDWKVNNHLRANIGLRADHLEADITADRIANSGKASDIQVSPKLNLAYRLSEELEFYANVGRGMHSNDARGAVISVDPNTGESAQAVPLLVPSTGREFGIRYEHGDAIKFTVTAFDIELDSELVFVGDAGSTEANDGSIRRGFETTIFINAGPKLQFDLAYTKTRANYVNTPSEFNAIPGSIETTVAAGINSRWNDKLTTSIRVRYLGGAPLIEDRTIQSGKSLLANAAATLSLGQTEIKLEALNLLDSDDADIAYYYDSRLSGEQPGGVADVHFHPLEPRSLRLTIERSF